MTKINEINLNVDEYTTPCPVSVAPDMGLDEVIRVMEQDSYRHLPVVDNNNCAIGIISERDLQVIKNLELAKKYAAGDFMIEDPVTVTAGAPLVEVVYRMAQEKIGSVVVADDQGKLNGIFTSTDALNALVEILRGEILD